MAIASTCNVRLSDITSDPLRGAICPWDWSGGSLELFARGLRSAEGLAWEPGADTRWVAANNRDNTPSPFDDGTGQYDKTDQGIQAHSAPRGLTFFGNGELDPAWKRGARVACHGSWNRTGRTGDKGHRLPGEPLATRRHTEEVDLVTGFKCPDLSVWGQPVDVALAPGGGFIVSDAAAGALYRIAATAWP
ncbi:hypothetical protein HMI51_09400 [Corallococcus coralloides]|nr:hypothetical protein [Corallococcus coralloides]